METDDAVAGRIWKGRKNRELLRFALLLVVAQVLLFAVLRWRKPEAGPTPPTASASAATAPQSRRTSAAPALQTAPAPAAQPEKKPLSSSASLENKAASLENKLAVKQKNGGTLVVLVSSRADPGNLTREQVRDIYLGKTSVWPNDVPIRVYNRKPNSRAGRRFFRSILGMSASAYYIRWNELQPNAGGTVPREVSGRSIMARVASSSGAIGYVLESELTDDMAGVRLIRFR